MSEQTTAFPPLRVHRTWVEKYPPYTPDRPLGARVHPTLEAVDVLEMLVDGQWVPVPVVEDSRPAATQPAPQTLMEPAAMSDALRQALLSVVPPAEPPFLETSDEQPLR